MAQLIVRNVAQKIVQELERRAALNGRSAEDEHRLILQRALGSELLKSSLKELLSEMPESADDHDFERTQDFGREVEF